MSKLLMTLVAVAFAGTTLTAVAQGPAKSDAPKATPATPATSAKGDATKATPATAATPSPKADAAQADKPKTNVAKGKKKGKSKSKKIS